MVTDHAAVIREALCDLLDRVHAGMSETRDTLAALDALLAERDALREQLAAPDATLGRLQERVETENWSGPLADELAVVKAERDAAVRGKVEYELAASRREREREEAAEASLTRYRDALEQIAALSPFVSPAVYGHVTTGPHIARAALDDPKEEGK